MTTVKMTFKEFWDKRKFDWYADRKNKENMKKYEDLYNDWCDYQFVLTWRIIDIEN